MQEERREGREDLSKESKLVPRDGESPTQFPGSPQPVPDSRRHLIPYDKMPVSANSSGFLGCSTMKCFLIRIEKKKEKKKHKMEYKLNRNINNNVKYDGLIKKMAH